MLSKHLFKLANTFYGFLGTGKKLEEIDTVLILGGSNGLGREICHALFRSRIVVVNVDSENPFPVSRSYKFIHCKDFADTSCVQDAMQRVKNLKHPITVLINNVHKNFESIYSEEIDLQIIDDSVDQMRDCIASNLTNVMIATKFFLKEIVSQTIQLTNGKVRDYYVVNMSTLLTLHVPEWASGYVSSKAALNQFHDALTSEYKCSPRRTKIKTLLVFLPYVKELEKWEYLTPYLSDQLVNCLQDGRCGDVLLRPDDSPLTACKFRDSTTCHLAEMLPKWKQ